jgi:hypothetical protein
MTLRMCQWAQAIGVRFSCCELASFSPKPTATADRTVAVDFGLNEFAAPATQPLHLVNPLFSDNQLTSSESKSDTSRGKATSCRRRWKGGNVGKIG